MKIPARLLAIVYAIAFGCSLVSAADAPRIRVVDRHTLSPGDLYRRQPPATAYQLTLTLVYFSGNDWSRDVIVRATRVAAGILAQCDVRLRRLELVRVDAASRYRYFHTPESRQLAAALQVGKPTVYFVTDTRQHPAFDAEAIGRSNGQTLPELIDTIWITRATPDVGIALAHELVHVLSDSGDHSTLPHNLMRDRTAPANTGLTPAQCARIRNVGTAHALLQSR